MKIKELLDKKGHNVYTVNQNQSLTDAIAIFIQHHVGSLLVLNDDGDILGIFTERDILNKCALPLTGDDEHRVKDFMTERSHILVATPDDDLEYAMEIMTNHYIRHLPIVEKGKLQGMLSIGDVVKAQLHRAKVENRYLIDYITDKYPG